MTPRAPLRLCFTLCAIAACSGRSTHAPAGAGPPADLAALPNPSPPTPDLSFPPIDFSLSTPDLSTIYDMAAAGDFAGESFPAPHTALPQILDSGGRRLPNPRLTNITFPGDHQAEALDTFLQYLPLSDWWTQTLSEYGVAAATTTKPVHLDEAAPKLLDDTDVQLWLKGKLDGTHPEFPVPDANSLYVINYPFGTTITLQGQVGCQQFAGYHSFVQVGTIDVVYAVTPRCLYGAGTPALDSVTGPISHEVAEATTDAAPYLSPAFFQLDQSDYGYGLATGSEVADMCFFSNNAFYKPSSFNFQVQRIWSNAAARAGHDPCIPAAPNTTWFNAAPRFTDTIHINSQAIPGILAAVGQSATIEVDLFSEGPTQPWQLGATIDATNLYGSGEDLSFSFDKATGSNGDKVHLTVTVNASGPLNYETFAITSTLGDTTNVWMVAVSDR